MQNTRKHILFLASWYPSKIFLDNGDFIQRHAQAISLLHDITVIHAVKNPLQKESKFIIEKFESKNLTELVVYVRPSKIRAFNLLYLLQAYLFGIKQLKSFDVIHLNVVYPAGIIAAYLKLKFKKPLVLTEHWTSLHQNRFKELEKYKQFIIQKVLDFVDISLTVSSHLGEAIKEINSKTIYKVIPNVVDLEKFDYKKTLKSKPTKFLHLSHLGDQHKNIKGMLNVINRLRNDGFDFTFHIGGNGDLEPINHFVKENNLKNYVITFGRLEHDEVNKKMQEADCFVLFSRYENQPCVQAEAFASGIPIIATKVGGIEEFFPKDFGILIDSENENQLYEAMKNVIEGQIFASPEVMNHFAKQHFAKQKIAQDFDEIYTEILK